MSVFFKEWAKSESKDGKIRLYAQKDKNNEVTGLMYHLNTEARDILNEALGSPVFATAQVRPDGDKAKILRKFIAIIAKSEEEAEAFKEASTKDMSEAEKAEFEAMFAKLRKLVYIDETE